MSVINISTAAYDTVVKKCDIVVIDCWAPWCQPCKNYAPIFEDIASSSKKENVLFAKCNVENEQDLAAKFGIRSIPTVLIVKDGEVVEKKLGGLTKEMIDQLVDKHS